MKSSLMQRIGGGLLAVALALTAGVADAGKILRQNADGTASWVNTTDDTATPAGEHHFTVTLDTLSTESTAYVMIPFAGRLKEIHVLTHGTIITATEVVAALISQPASIGGVLNQFTEVTPSIASAASGTYQVIVPLSYASTGQRASVDIPTDQNTSPNFIADSVIAIHTFGQSTAEGSNVATVTIVVH